MADPRRIREILGFGYGAPSSAMSALEPFHAGVDPAYMPQDVVTESPTEGPRGWVRSGLESLFGAIAPSDRAASNMAEKVTNLSDFVNVPQEAFDVGTEIGNTLQGGDPRMLAMSMIPGKAAEKGAKVAKDVAQTVADDLVPAVKAAQKGIRAYHGTPHDFEKFEWSPRTRGTGEGAQAYGQGLYFAENEGVAKGYRDTLAASHTGVADRALARNGGDIDATITKLQDKITNLKGLPNAGNDPERQARFIQFNQDAINELTARKSGGGVGKGHMYEVNINADPDAFLDWDKPLSQQQKVRQILGLPDIHPDMTPEQRNAALNALGVDQSSNFGGDLSRLTGADLIESPALKEAGFTEERMRQAGIPGIRFLDAGSRGNVDINDIRGTVSMLETAVRKNPQDSYLADQLASAKQKLQQAEAGGSRNYVVFSDEIIDIVKKYGIAGALGAGLITQQMADQLEAQQGGGQS